MKDFPFDHAARGWYRLAWSDEITSDQLLTTSYFGREQVSFRSSDGEVHVFDAYCPHLGAHLGFGGQVVDDCIVCPFHGWSWGPDGSNVDIPYATRPSSRRLTRWDVREIADICFVWYDIDGAPPQWEPIPIPESTDGRHHPIRPQATQVWPNLAVHPQALVENLADPAHLKFIHLSKSIPECDFEVDGHLFKGRFTYVFGEGRRSTWLSPDGPVAVELDTHAQGIGYTISRYGNLHGAVHLLGATPLKDGRSDMWAAAVVPHADDDSDGQFGARSRRLVDEMFKSHLQDLPVWENMRYVEHPPYPKLEARAHSSLRKWARQFYLPLDGKDVKATA